MQDFFLLPPASYRQGVYRTCGADPIMKISHRARGGRRVFLSFSVNSVFSVVIYKGD